MRIAVEIPLAIATAFATVFSLYAHTVLGVDSSVLTPILAVAIAGGLGLMALAWVRFPEIAAPSTPLRLTALLCIWVAWLLFAFSGVRGFADRAPTVNDWGLLLLQIGTPVLMVFNRGRRDLVEWLGRFCVSFAIIDAIANLGDLAHIWTLAEHGGRHTGEIRIDRIPGLTGNSHAGGLVGLVAVCWLAGKVGRPVSSAIRALIIATLVLIAASLVLIDARRYLGESAVAAALLIFPVWRVVPLWLVAPASGFTGVWLAFNNFDEDNTERADLMASGLRDALAHVFSGEGVYYRAPNAGIGFTDLWSAHVTESGLLELAIQYGCLATVIFAIGVLAAIGARRPRIYWPVALLTMMAGELAYGGALSGFLGAELFFGSLAIVIFDEGRVV